MIALILIAGLILRLFKLDQSLWLDEAINVTFVKNLNLHSLIFDYSVGDFHPPLYHIMMRGWVLLFGTSEIAVRLPSVILGLATVYVVYLIAKKLFDNKTALISATLIATSPLHVYYSQEARMYMLAAFFAGLSVYFFVSIAKKETLIYWFGFVVSTALMLYSDYLPYLLFPVYVIFLLIFRNKIQKSTVKTFLPAFVLIFVLVLPWFLIFPKQLATGLSAAAASPAWSNVVGASSLKDLAVTYVKFVIGRISNDNNLIYALLFAPAGAIFALMLFLSSFRMSHLRFFLWLWLLVPTIVAFLISFFVPVFAYFRFIFILPAFYMLIAASVNLVNWPKFNRIFLTLFLTINLVSLGIYFTNTKFQRENWKGAVSYIQSASDNNSIVLFEASGPFLPFDYYNKGRLKAYGALEGFNSDQKKVAERINQLTQDTNKVFLFQYLSQITDPEGFVFSELSKKGFANVHTKDFDGVGFVYEFAR